MIKETIKMRENETAIRIKNTRVEAVRIKDIVKKGRRVYQDGFIGISGSVGDAHDDLLTEKAIENLSTQIPYPYEVEKSKKDHRDCSESSMDAPKVLEIAESILETLRVEYPDFDFSEKMGFTETTQQMENSQGLDLKYKDGFFDIGLILKEKTSVNLFDGLIQFRGRQFDEEAFWKFNRPYLNSYRNKVSLPSYKRMPVLMVGFGEMLAFLNANLHGERFATGSSIFSDKMGEKLFSSSIDLVQTANPKLTHDRFFDLEGAVASDEGVKLISEGRLVRVFTDKRTSAQYDLPLTGAASGAYDGVPKLMDTALRFKTDAFDFKGLFKDQPAIFVVVSAGGDFTPDGTFAAPVQVSFLYDGENWIGKLPELTIKSNIYKLLGEDYLGTFDNPFYMVENSQIQAFMMDISE